MKKFERLRHIRYFSHSLRTLPKQYSSADTNRLSLVHFCIQALDILGCLPCEQDDPTTCGTVGEDVYINREEIIEWIYGLEVAPTIVNASTNDNDNNDKETTTTRYVGAGFIGSTYLSTPPPQNYNHSHIAMTYVALCTLLALGDNLSRINRHAILSTLRGLQKSNGSFVALSPTCDRVDRADQVEAEDDCDLRFMYAAIAVWYILTNFGCSDDHDDATDSEEKEEYINIHTATQYILSCKSYEGALGLTPGREGHGGSTFCGIASLYLLGVLDDVMAKDESWKDGLVYWCVMRQKSLSKRLICVDDGTEMNNTAHYTLEEEEGPAGMVGRPNKKEDTCYSYWIGGTLHLLSSSHLLDGWALREYVLKCQSPYGGFGKVVNAMPDLLHSFYSMAWLTLSRECCEEEEDEYGAKREGEDLFESEMRVQVRESIDRLSKLDCALGMCAKRRLR